MKKNKKMVIGISSAILGVIIVGFLALIIIKPGLGGSIISVFSSSPQPCSENPYDTRCICPEGTIKLGVSGNPLAEKGLGGYVFCESVSRVINLDIQGWEQTVEGYCLQRLNVEFPQCKISDRLNECNALKNSDWTTPDGSLTGKRTATWDCRKNIGNNQELQLAMCWFFVENGSVVRTGGDSRNFFCYDESGIRYPQRLV